jgi:hypothetical protein
MTKTESQISYVSSGDKNLDRKADYHNHPRVALAHGEAAVRQCDLCAKSLKPVLQSRRLFLGVSNWRDSYLKQPAPFLTVLIQAWI